MNNIYYSLWRNFYSRDQQDNYLSIINNSVALAKQAYPNAVINLVTDSDGKNFIKSYNIFDDIFTELDSLPKEYKKIPAIGKLKTYNLLSTQKVYFLHLEHDVFISRPIPEEIINNQIFVQHKYLIEDNKIYYLNKVNELIKNKYLIKNFSFDYAYNCGIFGGADFQSIKQYSSSALDMVLDIQNKSFFLNSGQSLEHLFINKNHFIEQYYLHEFSKLTRTKIEYLFKDIWWYSFIKPRRYGCVHLSNELKNMKDFYVSKLTKKERQKDRIWPPI